MWHFYVNLDPACVKPLRVVALVRKFVLQLGFAIPFNTHQSFLKVADVLVTIFLAT